MSAQAACEKFHDQAESISFMAGLQSTKRQNRAGRGRRNNARIGCKQPVAVEKTGARRVFAGSRVASAALLVSIAVDMSISIGSPFVGAPNAIGLEVRTGVHPPYGATLL